MTLAQQLVNRERTKTQMIDEGFNRHTHNVGGDGLPSWFLDDEHKHFRNNIPVTKEAVAAIREKLRELNARPIKKIAEAQARKKMRTIRRIGKTSSLASLLQRIHITNIHTPTSVRGNRESSSQDDQHRRRRRIK